MCETNAYIEKDGSEELYLENVDIIKPEEGRIFMKNLFGEQKFVSKCVGACCPNSEFESPSI